MHQLYCNFQELNYFMLECTSIYPETTQQKLESKRVYKRISRLNSYNYLSHTHKQNVTITISHNVHVNAHLFVLKLWAVSYENSRREFWQIF